MKRDRGVLFSIVLATLITAVVMFLFSVFFEEFRIVFYIVTVLLFLIVAGVFVIIFLKDR